jgi:S-ribosylhomocysteine lyase LuxS involved in autoinducer biosynthesis
VRGNKTVFDILPSLKKALYKTMRVTSIPGATEKECGNCGFMDLKDARREALEYLELLYTKYGVNYR